MDEENSNHLAYDWLNGMRAHWGRKSANEIFVWTSGYCTQDCHDLEEALMAFGFSAMSRDFDSLCGKTVTVYWHP